MSPPPIEVEDALDVVLHSGAGVDDTRPQLDFAVQVLVGDIGVLGDADGRVEERAGIKLIILREFIALAVIAIRARLEDHVANGARSASEFRIVVRRGYAHLLDRFRDVGAFALATCAVFTISLALGWLNWSPFHTSGGLNVDAVVNFLNRDGHDQRALPLGTARTLTEKPAGLHAEFRVADTSRGRDVLALAAEGALHPELVTTV